ncbi:MULTISPECIES: DUF5895 domain-containing protein [Leptolyngbya]|uniref:DUF5895 domain-containing protein n=1 Tax=Leptolyngbya TaxID=47251 RepID=UPI001689A85F|nr:DUF5895 domain-containing protein [Leptolyngbya sp. FACHB-1624]MBD1859307.1 hypothetical protein [Leptolyngbya sp. FACHB-1624]
MVNTKAKSSRTTTVKAAKAAKPKAIAFEIDPELLHESYNQIRRPQLPYGIVVNDKPAGILIPTDQLDKAGWLNLPTEEELHTVELTEEVNGLLITETRMLVLAFVPEYIRYKNDVEDLGSTVVGLYDEYRNAFDKKTMDACSEHAIVFLDEDNQPLHTTPIVVRFKNVALWSFKSAREEFYRKLERTFSDYSGQRYSGKSDKWRSLGVLEVTFKAVKEGEGNNKSWCCKTEAITSPMIENLPQLFLGTSTTKALIWGIHDNIAGFTEPQALPSLSAEPDLLPGATQRLKSARLELDDELDDLNILDTDAETLSDDEFDFDDDELED